MTPPIEPIKSSLSSEIVNNWYLLSVRAKKREVFLKYLDIAITQKQLQEIIVEIKIPSDSVYENLVLINTANFKDACARLKEVEGFQSIEPKPLPLSQVSKMLGDS
jgi:hypothetical protein